MPNSTRAAESVATFKKLLKTYLFLAALDSVVLTLSLLFFKKKKCTKIKLGGVIALMYCCHTVRA